MSVIDWIPGDTAHRVELVGKGNPTKPDTLNRTLRQVMSLSGLDPDADFTGFQPLATAFTKAQADALYAAVGAAYLKADADAKFATLVDTYNKAAADGRFAPIDAAYLKAAADAKFAALAGATFTGDVSTTGQLTAAGQINANGGVVGQMAVRVVTADATLAATDQVLVVDATGNNVLVTLPAASLGKYAWTVVRTDASAFTVTVAAGAGDTIVGGATLAGGETASVVLDGTSKAYVLHGVAATTIGASNITSGTFPDNVSFAGDAAFLSTGNVSFGGGAFFNGTVVRKVTSASVGATRTIGFASGYNQVYTLTANCTLSFSNANQGSVVEVLFKQDATGSRTLTWPGDTKLPTGFAIASAANGATKVKIWYDGSNYWVEKLADY